MEHYAEFKEESIRKRVRRMVEFREQVDVPNVHVKLSYGNSKTTALVPSVSLMPVGDCGNCAVCSKGCYDVRSVCWRTASCKQRANNSAIAHNDMGRYFKEINDAVRYLRFFRYHVGGDILNEWYWEHMVDVAVNNPQCEFIAFTKMFGIINRWLDKGKDFPDNLHIIFSDWRGLEMNNPHCLPVSSPVWKDGTMGEHVTENRFMCPGNCAECATIGKGCWTAKKGDTILFKAH